MKVLPLLVIAALLVAASATYTPEALKDEIINLPDAPKVDFRMFSGYIPVNNAGRKLFYWFVESQGNPEKDPLFIWTNGGPGCSGLIGKMTEHGPFKPTKEGKLVLRDAAWNKAANIIYFEQPAGVGYSVPESWGLPFDDATAANDNLVFIKNWFSRFPNYKQHEFYLSSESYGGHYLPTLALNIIKNNTDINFRGFMVGNPLIYLPYTNWGEASQYIARQLVPRPRGDEYIAKCKPDPNGPWPNPPKPLPSECDRMMREFMRLASGMDPYAIDFPICTEHSKVGSRSERAHFSARLNQVRDALYTNRTLGYSQLNPVKGSVLRDYFPDDYEPCLDNYANTYLNRADVIKALHAEQPRQGWDMCSDINYSEASVIEAMQPVYQEIHKRTQGKLKILIFSGDNDAVCSTIDSQTAIWTMGARVTKEWRQWKHEGQVAGFVVNFDGFSFATVHGAGHMAPSTRPDQSFELFKRYISGQIFTQ